MWYRNINNMCLYTITSWTGKFPGQNIPWSSLISGEAWSVGHFNPVNKSVKMHLAFNTRALLKQSRSLPNFLAQAVRGCSEDSKLLQWNKPSIFKKFRIEEFKCTRIERPWDHGPEKILSSITFWLSRNRVYVSCSCPFSDSSVSIFCRPGTRLPTDHGLFVAPKNCWNRLQGRRNMSMFHP